MEIIHSFLDLSCSLYEFIVYLCFCFLSFFLALLAAVREHKKNIWGKLLLRRWQSWGDNDAVSRYIPAWIIGTDSFSVLSFQLRNLRTGLKRRFVVLAAHKDDFFIFSRMLKTLWFSSNLEYHVRDMGLVQTKISNVSITLLLCDIPKTGSHELNKSVLCFRQCWWDL